MTSTEVAVVEAEEAEVIELFTETEAREHTTKIKNKLSQIADRADEARILIREAHERGAHTALGYPDFTEYCYVEFKDQLARLGIEDQRAFALEMSEQMQMPHAAIAAVMGKSRDAVVDDVKIARTLRQRGSNSHVDKPGNGKVVSRDHKTRPATRSTPIEIARRRDVVARLWKDGHTRAEVCDALGIAHGTLASDVAALGLEGKRLGSRTGSADQRPLGDVRWRNSETDVPPSGDQAPSLINDHETAACRVSEPSEVIYTIELDLNELTRGDRYRLSLKDRNRLIKILEEALGRLKG